MSDPTEKSPEVEAILEILCPSPIGRVSSIRNDVCVSCQGPAAEFKDAISKKEFRISGLCQKCQDEVFAPPPDDEEW